jgi:WXG100 family type VII secretion target
MPPTAMRHISALPPEIFKGGAPMDPRLSYNFDEIEASVRQEIHTASARFNAALQELRAQVAPLQELWTREAATAYQVEQVKWHQAATALNEILDDLGRAVRDGSDDVAAADRRASGEWARTGR